jgi:uncharacterized protein (TIGR03083 family)
MDSHQHMLDVLFSEWANLAELVRELPDEEFTRPTTLTPPDPNAPYWTVAELVAHLSFGANMVSTLIKGPAEGTARMDRVSFFTRPRAEVAPLVYQLSRDLTKGRTPAELRGELLDTFDRVRGELDFAAPELTGPAVFSPMTVREFVPTRIVEAVVHGADLTTALGRRPVSTEDGITVTSTILDGLLAGRDDQPRPSELSDNALWVRTASGRAPHPDARLPLLN